MLNTNLNVNPYFDDFSLDKSYFKYLFKSGDVIQVRELNGIQSLLQSQIEKLGNYIFTEGSVVVPGHASADTEVFAIPLDNFVNGVSVDTFIESLKNVEVIGDTSGIKAKILNFVKSTDSENSVPTLYVKYLSSSPVDNSLEFVDGELLVYEGNIIGSVSYINTESTKSILAKVTSGIYYVRGLFIETPDQDIVVQQYSNTGSYKIGFFIEEQIITALDDSSLYDNSVGSLNDTISGADRLKITLKLSSVDISTNTGDNFIELLRISNGNLVLKKKETVSSIVNSELQKNLARRTYDESGDYVVNNFKVSAKNTLNNFNNIGLYRLFDYTSNGKEVLISDSVNPETINVKKYYTLDLSSGKAYIKGFEIDKTANTLVEVPKLDSTESKNNDTTVLNGGTYLIPDSIQKSFSTSSYEVILFKNASNVTIGEAIGLGASEGDKLYIANLSTYTLLQVSNATGITAKGVIIGSTSGARGFIEDVSGTNIKVSSVTGSFVQGETLSFSNFALTPTLTSKTDYKFSDIESIYKSDGTTLIGQFSVNDPILYRTNKNRFAEIVEKNNTSVTDLSYYYVKTFTFNNTPLNNSEPFLGTGLLVDNTGNNSVDVTIASNGTVSGNGGITSGTIYAKVLKGNTTAKTKTDRVFKVLNVTSSTITDFYGTRYNDREISLGVPDVYNVLCVRQSQNPSNLLSTFSSVDLNDASSINIGDTLFGKDSSAAIKVIHKATNKIYFVEANNNKLINGETVYSLNDDSLLGIATTSEVTEGYYTDITNNYVLNKAINEDSYGISKLVLKEGYSPASSAIVIVYSYHEHSSTGDYFTISSYNADYDEIGKYENYNYSDLIDFRLSPSSTITGTGTLTSPFTLQQVESLDLTKTTFDFTNFVYPGSILTFDHTYYLGRIDRLYLRSDGEFGISMGEYSLTPKAPKVPEDSLILYEITYPTYIRNVDEIKFLGFDNRRYTMRDIGALEKRIENVEYYTSLNLLEVETSNLNILDENNLNKFKNGFIVDPFNSDYSITANYNDPQFKSCIDSKNQELRPIHYTDNISFSYINNTGLKLSKDSKRITLDYVEEPFIIQSLASKTENLNPFGTFLWNGTINLIPSTDVWVETQNLRPRNVNVEGNFSQISQTTNTEVVWDNSNNWVRDTRNITLGRFTINIPSNTETRTLTGVQNVVRPSIQTTRTTDLISSRTIDRVRRQYIKIVGEGLRPSTNISLLINNLNVSIHRLSCKLELENITGTFSSNGEIRFIRTIDSVDTVIAIATLTSWDSSTNTIEYDLLRNSLNQRIADIEDVIPKQGDKIVRVSNNATATIKSEINSTSLSGDYSCFVLIPFNTFDTGDLEFVLVNSGSETIGSSQLLTGSSTRAFNTFSVNGTLNTVQETIVSTRNAIVDQVTVTTTQTRRVDPLAQSFFIELEENSNSTGIFVTSIDLYFASKSSDLASKVKLSIRTIENGVPTNKIVPFSIVTKSPSDINISSNGSIPTRFEFDSPIYLKKDFEYCFVVEPGSSTDYNVFIARLGESDLVSNVTIDKQPYIGSLYKSQNQSVWEPSQFEDIKFVLNKADFSKTSAGISKPSNTGILNIGNETLRYSKLPSEPLEMASGSALVKVHHPNHCLHRQSTNYVKFVGLQSNIPKGVLGTTITQTNPSGLVVTITNSDNFPASGDLKIGSDIYSYTKSGTDFTITAYQTSSQHNTGEAVESYTLNGISLRDLNDTNLQVSSVVNFDYYYVTAPTNAIANLKAGGSSAFASKNIQYEIITPSIETLIPDSTNVSYKLNSYTGTSIFYKNTTGTEDPFVSINENRFIENRQQNFLPNPRLIASDVNVEENGISTDYTLSLTVNFESSDKNVSPLVDLERCYTLTTSNRINYEINADDTKLVSDTETSYVSNLVVLKNSATSAKVFVDALRFEHNEIECYIKYKRDDDLVDFKEIEYTQIPLVTDYPVSENNNDFREISFEINNLPSFKEAAFKIVMKSKSQAIIPKIKRFRGILLA